MDSGIIPYNNLRTDSSIFGCCLVTQSCLILCDPMDYSPPRLICWWDFPGKNTGEGIAV